MKIHRGFPIRRVAITKLRVLVALSDLRLVFQRLEELLNGGRAVTGLKRIVRCNYDDLRVAFVPLVEDGVVTSQMLGNAADVGCERLVAPTVNEYIELRREIGETLTQLSSQMGLRQNEKGSGLGIVDNALNVASVSQVLQI